jgi:hypothetical protein
MAAAAMAEPVTSGMLAHAVARSPALATWIAKPELLSARPHPVRDILAELLLSGAYSDGLAASPDPPGVPALFAMADAVLAGACAGDPEALGIVWRVCVPRTREETTRDSAKSGRGSSAPFAPGCAA